MTDSEFGQYSIGGRVNGRDWKNEWNQLPEEISHRQLVPHRSDQRSPHMQR